jgi:hypothetical protein
LGLTFKEFEYSFYLLMIAPLPTKPQSVLIERWLPYPQLKRKVIFQPSKYNEPMVPKPKNVINNLQKLFEIQI